MSLAGKRIARIATVDYSMHQIESQIAALLEAGADVTLVCSGFDPGDRRIPAAARRMVVPIARKIDILADVLAVFRLWRLFRRERFDLVHSTTPKAGLVTALAAWLAGVPVRLHTFTGQPWVTASGPKRALLKACDRLIGLANTQCYADSGSQRRFLIGEGVVGAARLAVLGSGSLAGVDLAQFDPQRFPPECALAIRRRLGLPEGARVVLFVGRLNADKGVRELVAAFRSLLATVPDAYLVLTGPVEDGLDMLLGADWQASLGGRALLTGEVDTPEEVMAVAELLALPSYREGFGTVIIEAAAMGVPTVGSAIYGISDAVVDGETGLLVPVRDPVALAAALVRLLEDGELRGRLGQAARRRAVTSFGRQMLAAAYVSECEKLLGVDG